LNESLAGRHAFTALHISIFRTQWYGVRQYIFLLFFWWKFHVFWIKKLRL
jgi:hypothetical protein